MSYAGEPNNVGDIEWCVELSTYAEGKWNDVNCDIQYSYICKKPSITSTPPPNVEPTKPPSKFCVYFVTVLKL